MLLIEPTFKVPTTATATIEPVNLFGAEQVAISTPGGNADGGPYLAPGASFAHAQSSDELGDLFAAATPLLNEIDTDNLSTVLGELAQASQGEGPEDRRLHQRRHPAGRAARPHAQRADPRPRLLRQVHPGHRARRRRPQQPERRDQRRPALVQRGGGRLREPPQHAHPVRQPARRAPVHLPPRHRHHPRRPATTSRGCSWPSRSPSARSCSGAYHYFQKIAEGASGLNKLPDGSTYAYFNTFILFSDVNSLVCNLIAPPTGGMSFLQPIQQALAGAGSAFNCSSELASFDALQANTATPAWSDAAGCRADARRVQHGRGDQRRAPRRPTRSTA